MKIVSISGSVRQSVGKKDAQKLRKDNKVPCVLYGGTEQIHFSTHEDSFKDIVFTPETCFIDINIDGKTTRAILQDIQYHPVNDSIVHADFLQISDEKTITLSIPLEIEGNSPGVMRGGKLVKKFRRITVKALPQNMPEKIVASIAELDIEQSIKIADLKSDKYELMHPERNVVVSVISTRSVVAEEATPGKK